MHDAVERLEESLVQPLRRARPWMKFAAIIGFIQSGFALIGALMMMIVFSIMPLPQEHRYMPRGLFVSMGLAELFAAVLVFVPSLLLFRYAMSLDRIEKNGTLEKLATALERQHVFWKFVGICIIIGICLWLLGMIVMFAFSFFMAAARMH